MCSYAAADRLGPDGSLTIGNIYGHGFDSRQVAALEAAGFNFRPGASMYAGSQLCRFIDFESGPSLELIEVTDEADYQAFVPAGMLPYCPGISLVVAGGSPAALDGYERDTADLAPYRLHVPYRGAEGPGWHYLNFAVPVLAGAFIWLTALDSPRPTPRRTGAHRNGVRGVAGLVFACDQADLERLAGLVGGTRRRGPLEIGGIGVVTTGAGIGPGRFPLRAVVLRADHLDQIAAGEPSGVATAVLGRPALRLETNPDAWELWITA